MVGRDKMVLILIASAWVVANVVFWAWWWQPGHVVAWPRFLVASFALAYDLTMMPAVFLFMVFKMRKPDPVHAPPGLRVAIATAIVPSEESIDVLERTLSAMVSVTYPHDSWVLDEGGDPRVRALCDRYGAHYWTRKGIQEFNQVAWPFQAKTKSGNYNSWFSQVGYDRYDFLVQLDTDHAPVESYLDEVLGYFHDPEVAYVALPSVYWNLHDWTARGSSEQSQIFQGPIQMGYYGWAGTPMIIGSHAAYRMAHLREIGGFAPSRAEDHLDSLRFAQKGYRGVFVPKVMATGLGPHTLADYLVQEHQWAFSIMQVLLKYGHDSGRLSWRQRIAFLFSESWYSLYSACYLVLFALPIYALLINSPIVRVSFGEFLLYSLPVTLASIVGLAWGYSKGWYRPGTHFFVSWQGILLAAARWPIVLVALVNAVISVVFRDGAFVYRVTPKGSRVVTARDSLRVALPFIVLAVIPIVTVLAYPWLGSGSGFEAAGYVAFALFSSILFTILVATTFVDHIRVNLKARVSLGRALVGAAPIAIVAALLLQGILLGGSLNRVQALEALTHRPRAVNQDSIARDRLPIAPSDSLPPASVTPALPTMLPSLMPSPTAESRAVSSWLFDVHRTGVTFGAYDPDGELSQLSRIDHLFTAWLDDSTGGVPMAGIRASYDRGVPVMLSWEPWPIAGTDSGSVVEDTIQGRYDGEIRRAADSVKSLQQPILIRFAHEMDMQGLYPWTGAPPDRYIAMYQHTVDLFRAEGATNVLWVWSPGGTLDSPRYYPGDGYVDYIGVTVLQYSGWETAAGFTPPREFSELVDEKYRLMAPFNKPIILAEVGIDLPGGLKAHAVRQMIVVTETRPKIRAVIYFNDRNPVMPAVQDRPYWRLRPADRAILSSTLSQASWVEPHTLAR